MCVFELFSVTFFCICFSECQLHRLSYQLHMTTNKQTKTQLQYQKAWLQYCYWNLETETLQYGVLPQVANTKMTALIQYHLNPVRY